MKKLATLVAALMLIGSVAACGQKAPETKAPETAAKTEAAASEAEGEAEITTVEAGLLVMGTNAAFPPYEFYENDKIVGIDAEIAEAIAEKLGLELRIDDMDFGSIITAVQTDKIDVGLAGMTVTEDRLKNVNFSESYATGIQSIIVAEGSDIESVDDLADHMIGVQENTTGHIYCSDDFGDEFVTAFPNGANAVEALKTGKVDCVVIDNEPAKAFVEANAGLKILDTEYAIEDYAIAVSKDNVALLDAVNAALAELKADGTLQAIVDKYISAE